MAYYEGETSFRELSPEERHQFKASFSPPRESARSGNGKLLIWVALALFLFVGFIFLVNKNIEQLPKDEI